MRKKKKKYANLIMLLLILFVLFFIVIQNKSIRISANELIQSYFSNSSNADKIFQQKDLEISGNVKSFIQFNGESFLELQSTNQKLILYCKLKDEQTRTKAESLTIGTNVTVTGKCLGIKPESDDVLLSVIYIETEMIK